MDVNIINLFQEYKEYALIISILINIVIALLGVVPSYFLTLANLIFFGFWQGVMISFLGEALGAVITFILYRKGFKKIADIKLDKYPKIKNLIYLEGRKAFAAIFSLRLIPFIPSGLVTLGAAIGKVNLFTFSLSSSIGKIPALLLEGYTVYQIIDASWQGILVLLLLGLALLYWNFKSA